MRATSVYREGRLTAGQTWTQMASAVTSVRRVAFAEARNTIKEQTVVRRAQVQRARGSLARHSTLQIPFGKHRLVRISWRLFWKVRVIIPKKSNRFVVFRFLKEDSRFSKVVYVIFEVLNFRGSVLNLL